MTIRFSLIAGVVAVGLMASPASAETDSEKLRNLGETAAFMIACPKHWERLPPRTQRLIVALAEDASRKYDQETIRRATAAEYANGYDKQGERWCASMETILTNAGRF